MEKVNCNFRVEGDLLIEEIEVDGVSAEFSYNPLLVSSEMIEEVRKIILSVNQ